MRYLLVGYGNIGAKRRAVLGGRCVATVDPFNSAADYVSPEQCPLDQYDAVILAVPNEAKLNLLEHFLHRGKHVLVEKPLLLPDRETAGRLERIAREHTAVWYTSYNHRFEPNIASLKERLDTKTLGRIYHARLLYGNGTVQNIMGTWREEGYGALEDLGSHLVDLTGHLFGCRGADFAVWDIRSVESKSIDFCILATRNRQIVLECSFVSWKNSFTIDIYGEHGSIHLNGLCKWGPSELVVRRRRFPSGVPDETREVVEVPDPTWEADVEYFESLVAAGRTSCENDWWISRTILAAAASSLV